MGGKWFVKPYSQTLAREQKATIIIIRVEKKPNEKQRNNEQNPLCSTNAENVAGIDLIILM